MTEQEVTDLANSNLTQVENMRVTAGSMIQALLDGIADSDNGGPVYIRLSGSTENKTYYNVLEGGDVNVVKRVARSLGMTISDEVIRVPFGQSV